MLRYVGNPELIRRRSIPAIGTGGGRVLDSERFDNAAKLLAPGLPRRRALATLALSGLGLAGHDNAEAKRKKKKKCPKGCREPQQKCTDRCPKCCPDSQGTPRFCELVPVCPESADGKYCCGKEGTECGQDCDCCSDLVCPHGACCVGPGVTCDETTLCCGDCQSGECCTLEGEDCWETEDCCAGLTCEGVVLVPLTPGKCEA